MLVVFLFYFFVLLLSSACAKKYQCVCKSNVSGFDTIVDKVKTTKLGSKGYKETCDKMESVLPVSNCLVY